MARHRGDPERRGAARRGGPHPPRPEPDGLSADFPLEILPLVTVRQVDQAAAVAKGNHDVTIMYAARRNRPLLEALAAPDKWNLMFVRHRSGPLYYMYIGAHTHFLRKTRDEFGQPGMDVHDIVVDDHARAALAPAGPRRPQEHFGQADCRRGRAGRMGRRRPRGARAGPEDLEAWTSAPSPIPDLGKRIEKARQDEALVKRCRAEAEKYLKQEGVTLETSRDSVDRAFLLDRGLPRPPGRGPGRRDHHPSLHEHHHADLGNHGLPAALALERRGLPGLLRVRLRRHSGGNPAALRSPARRSSSATPRCRTTAS